MIEDRRKYPERVLRMLVSCLLIYAAVVLLVYLIQDRMLYYPSRASLDQVRQSIRYSSLKLWPRDNEDYAGFITGEISSAVKGTVIVFHGNAGAAQDRRYYLQPLQSQGFRVILAEYPGYGARGGKIREETLVADGRNTVRTAVREFNGPVYLWGESIGCGIATGVAADPDLKIDGIVLLTPWDSLPATAQSHYWFLPARWIVRDRYDNIGNLRHFSGPVAVLMADKDTIIPNRRTQILYQNIHPPKRLWTFEGAGHNSWPVDPDLPWWSEVMDFVTEERSNRATESM